MRESMKALWEGGYNKALALYLVGRTLPIALMECGLVQADEVDNLTAVKFVFAC